MTTAAEGASSAVRSVRRTESGRRGRSGAGPDADLFHMTFTEAAVEVLRRAGKPLHFTQIAQDAVTAGLLSHVGHTPEETMGARLLSMARRENDRTVMATDTGMFALVEWGLGAAQPLLDTPPEPAADEPTYRPKERHPPVRDEIVPGGRREDRRRGRDSGDEGRRRRYPPPAEVAHALLREQGMPMSLEELARALRGNDRIAEALERDLPSLERALREENRRRKDSGRSPLFDFGEDGRVTGLEIPKEAPSQRRPERGEQGEARRERREEVRVPSAVDEQRRQAIRSVRRRLGSLDLAAFERTVVALLEAQGYRDLHMAKRSGKEGTLYLVRRRLGAGEWRFAVRVLRPGRDLGRPEVQEVRRDLAHYSAQVGMVFGASECSREAKSEANAPGTAPVILHGSESLAEALVEAGLGVRRRMVEWLEFDDLFFTEVGAGEPVPMAEEPTEAPAESEAAEARPQNQNREEGERGRRGRGRRRDRGRDREGGARPESADAEAAAAPSTGADEAPQASEPVEHAAPEAGASSSEVVSEG